MLYFIIRRTLYSVLILLGVVLLTFLLFNVAAGAPAAAVLGKNARPDEVESLRRELGADLPLFFGRRCLTEAYPAGRNPSGRGRNARKARSCCIATSPRISWSCKSRTPGGKPSKPQCRKRRRSALMRRKQSGWSSSGSSPIRSAPSSSGRSGRSSRSTPPSPMSKCSTSAKPSPLGNRSAGFFCAVSGPRCC